jgi:hypothetical protein
MKERGARSAVSSGPQRPLVLLSVECLSLQAVNGGYAGAVSPRAARPTVAPNVHPDCRNAPGINEEGFEELCHLVTERDPDTALCGKDVTGYPWDPPWPRCEACLAVARGDMN